MWFDPELALDYLSSLAALAILAWGFGLVRQRGMSRHLAPIALGLGFGLVAVLQMNAAFQPAAGFLLDLRLVPVGLAGAYLGRRGLAACLVVALAGRYQIGGVGAHADMASICLAGYAGLAWAKATRMRDARGVGSLIILAFVTSAGFLPALLLPMALFAWFVVEALPVLMVSHLLSVTALAALLERVRSSGPLAWVASRAAEGGEAGGSDMPRVLPKGLAGGAGPPDWTDLSGSHRARARLRTGFR